MFFLCVLNSISYLFPISQTSNNKYGKCFSEKENGWKWDTAKWQQITTCSSGFTWGAVQGTAQFMASTQDDDFFLLHLLFIWILISKSISQSNYVSNQGIVLCSEEKNKGKATQLNERFLPGFVYCGSISQVKTQELLILPSLSKLSYPSNFLVLVSSFLTILSCNGLSTVRPFFPLYHLIH